VRNNERYLVFLQSFLKRLSRSPNCGGNFYQYTFSGVHAMALLERFSSITLDTHIHIARRGTYFERLLGYSSIFRSGRILTEYHGVLSDHVSDLFEYYI
jgi:hypothetical protein